MKIEHKFRYRTATLLDIDTPAIAYGKGYSHGIVVAFRETAGGRVLHMHMTPQEACDLGERLTRIGKEMGAES